MPLYTKNLLILLTSVCLFFSSFYLLFPTLPLYVQHIGGNQRDVGLIIGIFTLSSVLFRPLAGNLIDTYGRRTLLLIGVLIFCSAPIFYNSSSTVRALVAVRIFHGTGIAAFTVSSIAMIADMSPPHRRGEALGAFGLSAMVALSGSPALGTWVVTHFSFGGVFFTEAILAVTSLFLSLLVKESLHTKKDSRNKQNLKGVFLPSLIIFLCTLTYGSIVSFLPFFGGNITDSGLYYIAYALSSIGIRIPVGRISDRVGRQKIILPGLLTISVALLLLSLADSSLLFVVSGFVYGLGFSSVYPILTALLIDRVPEGARAQALSIFTASFDLGIALGSFGFSFIPLPFMYPVGSFVIFSGFLLFYFSERSSFSSSF